MRISDWSSDVCSSDLWVKTPPPACGRGEEAYPARCLVHIPARAHGADHRQIILDRDRFFELDTGLAAQRPDDLGGGAADDRHAEDDEVADLQPAFEAHQQTDGADRKRSCRERGCQYG